MSWEEDLYEVEVTITGLCVLMMKKATSANPKVWFVKPHADHQHQPMLTYRLDNYLGPEPDSPVDIYPDAEGNLIGQIPLKGDLTIGPAKGSPPEPSLAKRTALGRLGALDYSLDHVCGADDDMKLDLKKLPSGSVLHTARFKGGQIATRKPVANADGSVSRWKRSALPDPTILSEQIVWRTRISSTLLVKDDKAGPMGKGQTYEFGRTSFICLSLSSLPPKALPGSATKGFKHWEMFAKAIGQDGDYKAPQKVRDRDRGEESIRSHGSSSCPPTGGWG